MAFAEAMRAYPVAITLDEAMREAGCGHVLAREILKSADPRKKILEINSAVKKIADYSGWKKEDVIGIIEESGVLSPRANLAHYFVKYTQRFVDIARNMKSVAAFRMEAGNLRDEERKRPGDENAPNWSDLMVGKSVRSKESEQFLQLKASFKGFFNEDAAVKLADAIMQSGVDPEKAVGQFKVLFLSSAGYVAKKEVGDLLFSTDVSRLSSFIANDLQKFIEVAEQLDDSPTYLRSFGKYKTLFFTLCLENDEFKKQFLQNSSRFDLTIKQLEDSGEFDSNIAAIKKSHGDWLLSRLF